MKVRILKYFRFISSYLFLSMVWLSQAQAIDLETALWHYQRNDFVPAFLDFQILAAEGDVTAMAYLGRMYRQGYAVKKNLVEAEKWLSSAAEGDVPMANHRLGWMYAKGEIGESRDMAQAAKYWERAANLGDPAGQLDIGVMYWRGEGVPKDLIKAHAWLLLSAKATEWKASTGNLDNIIKEMSEEQINQGKVLAKKIEASIEKGP